MPLWSPKTRVPFSLLGVGLLVLALAGCTATPINLPLLDSGTLSADRGARTDAAASSDRGFYHKDAWAKPDARPPDASGDGLGDASGDGIQDAGKDRGPDAGPDQSHAPDKGTAGQ